MKNFFIFVSVTVNSLFCVTLCQAYLKPNAHYAIGTVDALASLTFLSTHAKLETRTNLLCAFATQAAISFTLAMILLGSSTEAMLRFKGLTGFSVVESKEQELLDMDHSVGTKEASLYTLVLLIRFASMLSLITGC